MILKMRADGFRLEKALFIFHLSSNDFSDNDPSSSSKKCLSIHFARGAPTLVGEIDFKLHYLWPPASHHRYTHWPWWDGRTSHVDAILTFKINMTSCADIEPTLYSINRASPNMYSLRHKM